MGERIRAFIEEITEKQGVVCGVCTMDEGLFHADLRKACESNACGNYGKCYTCPPYVGTPDECVKKALNYEEIIVFQKIYTIEDSFDYEGMMTGQKQFKSVQRAVADLAAETFHEPFVLGAGGCTICPRCAARTWEPCRFPQKAIASLESYCIQVSELAKRAGMKYINGQNTVTYFGAVLLKEKDAGSQEQKP